MTTPRVPEKARPAFPVWIFALVGCIVVLPVIVAVVGILAAIAIPNFIRYQCLSKQSEAKMNLAGLYTAEKVFYGEYGYYTSDLRSLNWEPVGSPLYLYGFAKSGPDYFPSGAQAPNGYDPNRKDTSDPLALRGGYSTDKMRNAIGMQLSATDLPYESAVGEDGQTFVAAAVGEVDSDGGSLDVWTIDDTKSLVVTYNDCMR